MRNNLILFMTSIIISLSFAIPVKTQGMDTVSIKEFGAMQVGLPLIHTSHTHDLGEEQILKIIQISLKPSIDLFNLLDNNQTTTKQFYEALYGYQQAMGARYLLTTAYNVKDDIGEKIVTSGAVKSLNNSFAYYKDQLSSDKQFSEPWRDLDLLKAGGLLKQILYFESSMYETIKRDINDFFQRYGVFHDKQHDLYDMVAKMNSADILQPHYEEIVESDPNDVMLVSYRKTYK